MALKYYVSPTADGTGDGSTVANALTAVQAGTIANFTSSAFGATFAWLPGVYNVPQKLFAYRRSSWVAADFNDKPVLRATDGFTDKYLVEDNIEGASLNGFVLQARGLTAGFDFAGGQVHESEVTQSTGAPQKVKIITKTAIEHNHGTAALFGTQYVGDCKIVYTGSYNSAVYLSFRVERTVIRAGTNFGTFCESAENVLLLDSNNALNMVDRALTVRRLIAVGNNRFHNDVSDLNISEMPSRFRECSEYANIVPLTGAPADFVSENYDPFVNRAAFDFRLTAEAKGSPNITGLQRLRSVLATLVYVPDITLDPLEELLGLSSGAYNPFKSPAVFGGQ